MLLLARNPHHSFRMKLVERPQDLGGYVELRLFLGAPSGRLERLTSAFPSNAGKPKNSDSGFVLVAGKGASFRAESDNRAHRMSLPSNSGDGLMLARERRPAVCQPLALQSGFP
jgi:hypothetical protein